MLKLLLAAWIAVAFLRAGSHQGNDDRGGVFTTINIEEGHPAGDVACAFCTVNVKGDITGDVAVLFGSVNVDPDRTISGDVAILFSSLHLGENDRIHGDLAAALSSTDIPASASVSGSRAVLASGFGLTVLAGPVLILGGIIGLIIFWARRSRYPYPVR